MSEVHGIPIKVNPDILSVELGVQRVRKCVVEYPMPSLQLDERAKIASRLSGDTLGGN